ncbi:hypothetical protein GALMADRAFT_64883 [Galerina marginata CBS 339.88]|uniref:Uncharacterized protein n=1 Tax=Galerina marginata (strain CBS 339.88) TaxID=685588 RepID=A0A067T584_GALM3|nr:hypothetical protein GALMADRAFT_64883 [Galerina marginata CBS 339.88]
MTSKSLNTSTLSLRFMQNAQRANQQKEVELDRAEVKDDGKWEISQAVRDSWGLSKETQSESSDVHEASYLPFIFSTKRAVASDFDADATVRTVAGRRVFNKKGEEVSLQVASSSEPTTTSLSSPTIAPQQPTGRKVHPRPISISASGTSGQLRGFESLKKPKDSKTARQAIFDSGGVGTDLRTQARTSDSPSNTPTTFMKPAGIDDPKNLQASSSNADTITNNARQKIKRDRERDATADEPSDVTRKPKKKKKKNPE